MNPMRVVCGSALAVVLACAGNSPSPAAKSTKAPVITAQTVNTLFAAEPQSIPADYSALQVQYRLLGVQPGDGLHGFATIMNMSNYQTTNLQPGKLLGRNLKLSQMQAGSVDLTNSLDGSTIHLSSGAQAQVLQIDHKFDTAALYQGKSRYLVQTATLQQIQSRYGAGATTQTVFLTDRPLVQLTAVDPNGSLARMGFQQDDVITSVGNLLRAPSDPNVLAQTLLSGTGPIQVSVMRNAAALLLTYDRQ